MDSGCQTDKVGCRVASLKHGVKAKKGPKVDKETGRTSVIRTAVPVPVAQFIIVMLPDGAPEGLMAFDST